MSTPITIPVNFDFTPGFGTVPRAAAELQRLFNRTGALNSFAQPLGRISRSADEFANSLKAANARLLAFGASAVVLITVQRALEGLVSSTINVEKRLTDINVVLGESRAGLQKFGSELFSVARQTGQSFNIVSDAALELSRQGLSVQETLKRTKDALVLTRLSGLDAKNSVDALTAGINSFNKTLISSTDLVNKFAAVDARFAVSSADLAEALKRVGSTAQDAGVSLDELLGLVTAVQQTTARGGAVIGNAFKNIFSRLSRSTTIEDLRNLGVQINETQSGVEKLRALSDAYTKVGKAQASQIKEAAGGVYQINIVSAALDQLSKKYGVYEQALNSSKNAAGEAAVRNEELNKTLAALINRTEVNFTQLFSNVGSLSIDTPLRNILGGINSALESAADKEDGGGKLAESFLKGIAKFIEGPGLVYLGTIGLSLSRRLIGFAGDAFKQLNSIRFGESERRLNTERAIQSILERNPAIQQQIINGTVRIEDLQNRILADLRDEVVLRERIAALSQRIAPAVSAGGVRFNRNSAAAERTIRSSGHIPTADENMAETMGAYAAGYQPGKIKAANIKGLGRIVYNDAEKVVDIGMSQPAIIPPANSKVSGVYKTKFQQRFGVDPYQLANGHVPNFRDPTFSFFKDAFGDQNFETPFGSGVVDINGKTARIDVIKINPNFQGSGKTAGLYSGLSEALKNRGVESIIGQLRPQYDNEARGNDFVSKTKALLPQLTRGRFGKYNVLNIGKKSIRLAGGSEFDNSLAKQAKLIYNAAQSGDSIDYETFLNKGLVPNFLPTGLLRHYRRVFNKLKGGNFNAYINEGTKEDAFNGYYSPSDDSINLNINTPKRRRSSALAHEGVHNLVEYLAQDSNFNRAGINFQQAIEEVSRPAFREINDSFTERDFPGTYKRITSFPRTYTNPAKSYLEESLADNSLAFLSERTFLTKNLQITDRQAETASRLFNRLEKVSKLSGVSNGLIPNFLPTGLLRPYRKVRDKLKNKQYGTFDGKGVEGLYIPSADSIYLSNGARNPDLTLAHEGVHNVINYLGLGKKLSKLSTKNYSNFQSSSTASRMIQSGIYKDIDKQFLEEALADNALSDSYYGSSYAKVLGLSSRQAKTAVSLFNRLSNSTKNNGLVPNFNALNAAILRESSAVNPSQVRVGKDTRLVSSKNPAGLGVYNTKDEPGGLGQGIARAYAEGLNPKNYNVPNYADKIISGGQDPLIRVGAAAGKTEVVIRLPDLTKAGVSFAEAAREARLDEEVKSRNDARSNVRQREIQEEEKFIYNTSFRREQRERRAVELKRQEVTGTYPQLRVPGAEELQNEARKRAESLVRLPKNIATEQKVVESIQDLVKLNEDIREEKLKQNDVEDRESRRLANARNTIGGPRFGSIVVPIPQGEDANRGIDGMRGKTVFRDRPPIILPTTSNGRIFIPGVSDLAQNQRVAEETTARQAATRGQEESRLRSKAQAIFGANKAQRELVSRGFVNQDDLVNIQNNRLNKLQNLSLGVSFGAPILSQIAADKLQNNKQSGRIAGAAASGLGDVVSFGATAFTATGGNPAAAIIGAAIGALNGLVNVIKEAGNTIPELTDKIERLSTVSNDGARAANEYVTLSEQLANILNGKTPATKGELKNLQSQQGLAFGSLSPDIRRAFSASVKNDDIQEAFRILGKSQGLITQQIGLLQQTIRGQQLNKESGFNLNQSGLSARNVSEFSKFSIDNPLLGGGGGIFPSLLGGSGTDARSALRIFENNSIGALLSGAVNKSVNTVTFGGANRLLGSGDFANEVFNTEALTTSEQKDLLKNRRRFNNENNKTANLLAGFTNETGDVNLAELAANDPELQAALSSGKSIKEIFAKIRTLAKKNNFNNNAIAEFLEDYSVQTSSAQQDLLPKVLRKTLGSDGIKQNKLDAQQITTAILKRENSNFQIDRSLNNRFSQLADTGTELNIGLNTGLENTTAAFQLNEIKLRGSLDRSGLLGGERTQVSNQQTLELSKLRNATDRNIFRAQNEFESKSFDSIRKALTDSINKVSENSSKDQSTAAQRQDRITAVDSVFSNRLKINKDLNVDDLSEPQLKALRDRITSTQNELLSARENNRSLVIDGKSLNSQDINDVISSLDGLFKSLNDNFSSLAESTASAKNEQKNQTDIIKAESGIKLLAINYQNELNNRMEKTALVLSRVNAVGEARFENSALQSINAATVQNLGLVGNARLNADTAANIGQLQLRNNFNVNQLPKTAIQQAINQKGALGIDLDTNNVRSLSDIQSRSTVLQSQISKGLNVETNTDLLRQYNSLQTNIVEEQNKLNELLPEQIAQQRIILDLKEQELKFNTAFSEEKARLNQSAIEGRIRQGQGVSVGDFTQTIGDQFSYTGKDFQRDAISGTADVANTIKSSFASATADVIKNGKSIKDALTGVLTGVLEKVIDKTSEISTNFLFSGLKAVGSSIGGFSEGGRVTGGSGVRDDVPALLTKGEYVIKKDAVQKIGLQNLEKLNAGVKVNLRNEYSYDDEKRPTRGFQNIDPNLSVIGLTETDLSRTNQLKFAREQELSSYLNEYRNYEKSKSDALNAYKNQKRNRLYGSYISAGLGVAGAGASTYFGNYRSSPTGGADYSYPAKRAAGGSMFGGTSSSDTVRASLTGGEFVVKKSVVDSKGVNFFNSLNNGYAEGGLVRQAAVTPQAISYNKDMPAGGQTNNISNQSVNNVSISINIASDGKASSSTQDDNKKKGEQGKALSELINSKVKEVLVKESSQGGLVYNLIRNK